MTDAKRDPSGMQHGVQLCQARDRCRIGGIRYVLSDSWMFLSRSVRATHIFSCQFLLFLFVLIVFVLIPVPHISSLLFFFCSFSSSFFCVFFLCFVLLGIIFLFFWCRRDCSYHRDGLVLVLNTTGTHSLEVDPSISIIEFGGLQSYPLHLMA